VRVWWRQGSVLKPDRGVATLILDNLLAAERLVGETHPTRFRDFGGVWGRSNIRWLRTG